MRPPASVRLEIAESFVGNSGLFIGIGIGSGGWPEAGEGDGDKDDGGGCDDAVGVEIAAAGVGETVNVR